MLRSRALSSAASLVLAAGLLAVCHSGCDSDEATPSAQPVCGDAVCDDGEDCSSCSADCGPCPVCGDGTCDASESCDECVEDCGVCQQCGDGTCDPDETCDSCPDDCGPCSPVCWDGVCDPGEDCVSCPRDCGACTSATLLFASGFEGTTDVCNDPQDTPPCDTAYACGTTNVFLGVDGEYAWPDDLPGNPALNFVNDVIASSSPDCCASGCLASSLDECHQLDVVETDGHDGQPTRALHYQTFQDCSDHSTSRLQYNMRADHTTGNDHDQFNPIYFRYWMRMQSTLVADMPDSSWRQLWEFYYQDNDWSNELLLVNWGDGLRWRLDGRFYDPVEAQWTEYSDQQLPVSGEWFLLETYLRSHRTDGRIVVRINGQTIFDVGGPDHPTHRRDGQQPETVCMLKMYTNRFGQQQWMDNLEIWTDIPY